MQLAYGTVPLDKSSGTEYFFTVSYAVIEPAMEELNKCMLATDTTIGYRDKSRLSQRGHDYPTGDGLPQGYLSLASDGVRVPRIGVAEPLTVGYNGKSFKRSFEVMNLARKHPISLGWDFMPTLGIGYVGLATAWTEPAQTEEDDIKDAPFEPNDSPAGTPQEMQRFMNAIQPVLNDNANIKPGTFCNIPQSVIELNTPPDAKGYRRQYEFLIARRQIVEDTVDEWLKEGIITEVPANVDNGCEIQRENVQ